ncbi:hypothetical protein ACP70R_044952 [Stipagrostis hirtigluma subsp. patula]
MGQKRAAWEPPVSWWEPAPETTKKNKAYYWEKSPFPEFERHLEKARPVLARDAAIEAQNAAVLGMIDAAIRESRERSARKSKAKNHASPARWLCACLYGAGIPRPWSLRSKPCLRKYCHLRFRIDDV